MTDLADLAARIAIQDLVARYAAAWDDRDTQAFIGTFVPEGVLEAPIWTAEGHDALAAMVETAKQRSFGSRHCTSNHRIRMLSPDAAEADLNFFVLSRNGLDHSGRYRDSMRCLDGAWLFERRRVTVEWQSADTMWPPMNGHIL